MFADTDLAYVGFFCIAAGVELGTGVNLADVTAWPGFAHEAVLLKLVPTIAATLALLLTMRSVVPATFPSAFALSLAYLL